MALKFSPENLFRDSSPPLKIKTESYEDRNGLNRTDNACTHQQGRLRVYIHGKDDVPGSPVYSSLIDALERSRKIVIVLSNSFLKSEKCRGLADLAGMKLMADLERSLKVFCYYLLRRKYISL